MGFRENLKTELSYQNILVKELAAAIGISKKTIDNYLNNRGFVPSADVAVKIAQVLEVSVEYLVTGDEHSIAKSSYGPEIRDLVQNFKSLNTEDRELVVDFLQLLKNKGAREKR